MLLLNKLFCLLLAIDQTVKCLLIVPNAESALNEEAGKLLLEDYDEYFSRAKLYTEIHARSSISSKNSQYNDNQSSSSSSSSLTAASTSKSSANNASVNASSSSTNPLDSNKTIQATSNNQSSSQASSDEPSIKMAKLHPNAQAKKNDKKKALKRL